MRFSHRLVSSVGASVNMILLVVLCGGVAFAKPWRVTSPDGNLVITFEVGEKAPVYQVAYQGRSLILESNLGLSLYSGRFKALRSSSTSHHSQWSPVYGERQVIPDHYHQLAVELQDQAAPFRPLRITFRAYNEGFAFRYTILGQGNFLYGTEQSEFHFPAQAMAYEEYWSHGEYKKAPVAAIQPGCERPLTVDYGDGVFASLTEAALVDYPRMLLSPVKGKPGVLFSDLGPPFPRQYTSMEFGTVRGSAPFSTPWRVMIVGDRPGDLLERNYLVLNLNPPSALKDSSWIKPGKAIRDVRLSTRSGKECVDFAVRHGLQYVEFDAGWYGNWKHEGSDATRVSVDPKQIANLPDHGGLDLAEVIAYAKQRNIGIFLYVDRWQLERQMEVLFPLYRQWGVKGVKFGFVNVGAQEWSSWLHEAVRKAAENRLLVDIHDHYRPTGFSRTYPNLLTQEGIRGNEMMPTAEHNTTLPFTRYIAGAADYTVCYYDDRLKTTRAHQLAMAVISYSPLQFLFWYDRPSDYQGEPEIEFFKRAPTVWDETRVIAGQIGEYATIARRSGDDWFIGTINNSEPRTLDLPLSFLQAGKKYMAHIYSDDPSVQTRTRVKIERLPVDSRTVLKMRLSAAGGQAARIVFALPQNEAEK